MRAPKRLFSIILCLVLLGTAVLPVYAAPAQAKSTVTVQIQNKTGDKVTLSLSGPSSYWLYPGTGKTKAEVLPGKYTYSYQACGKTNTGKLNAKGNSVNLVLAKCPKDKTIKGAKEVKVTVKNQTGGSLSIYMTGTKSYTFYLGGGTSKISIAAGKYSYTVYGCGTSLSGSKNFKGGGNSWMFWCY